jgi:hypothetical protein
MMLLRYAALTVLAVLAFSAGPAMPQPNFGQVAPFPQLLMPDPGAPQARFVVTAVRLYANDETGPDFPGSDEIYLVFGNPAAGRYGYSSIFGDFDTGETRDFAASQWCLAPISEPIYHQNGNLIGWQCQTEGIGGPFSFALQLFESDSAWTPQACLGSLPTPVQCQDDLVGSQTVSYSAEELIAAMPRIGDTVTESVRLGGYTFTWLVQRIADSGTPPVIR